MSHYSTWFHEDHNAEWNSRKEHAPDNLERTNITNNIMRHAALGAGTPGIPDAIGIMALCQYLEEQNIRPLRTLWDITTSTLSLIAGLFQSHANPQTHTTTINNSVFKKDELIPVDELEDLFREVRRHQWLEAEKAGRDVWSERCPEDPEGLAFRDWVTKHYEEWRSDKARVIAA